MLLEARNLTVSFGAVRALDGIDFTVEAGEIVALVGPNGAGKSTALKAVFGLVEPDGGEVTFNGETINGLRPDERVTKGIALVPEGRQLFPSMTVTENLEMGAFTCDWQNRNRDMEQVLELLPALRERRKLKAGVLSTGEQQLLAFGRALMQKPKLLLADEPTLGLSPSYMDIIFDTILEINRQGTGILLVEQNATQALEIAHRGYVLRLGSVFAKGTGMDLLENEALKRAFIDD
ncbi:MAG: branched-chain amino acid transport system ATP-binding [Geobacteraceae bacterium]|nr:MAG: branched-chain amino acid transport system ATP-binding [Geobacteraceae bacterium]